MSIIKVPESVVVSPQDRSPMTFDTDTRLFRDERGNDWSVAIIAGSRPGNRIRKWVNENYPPARKKET